MKQANDEKEWAGKTGQRNSWDQFDALPRGVKRLFWSAPYDYTALPAYRAWRRGVDMRAACQKQVQAMARDVARESTILWGEAQQGWL